jgi:cytoskeletal protein CcmA (bactofilin family)
MWKAREENNPMTMNPPQPSAAANPVVNATTPNLAPRDNTKSAAAQYAERADVGHIGKSVVIRGELTGNEDLYLDGEIEGNIDLRDHKLVIGPNGKIKATITARDIVLHGRVEGNVSATERVELKKSCSLVGDVSTQRIVIEDGAFFKGAIDIKENKENRERKTTGSGVSVGAPQAYSASSS